VPAGTTRLSRVIVAQEALADATAVAPEAPENEQVVAACSSRAAGAAVAVAASATTATEMNEPNIVWKKAVRAMSDERVGWKEIEAWWMYHLHTMADKHSYMKS
jgi:hypothetical protein